MREEPKMETWLIREARGTSLYLWQFWFKASTDGFSVQINPCLLERAHLLQRHHAETVACNCPSRTRQGERNKWCVPPPVNQRWRASAVTSRKTNGRHAGELIFSMFLWVGMEQRRRTNAKCVNVRGEILHNAADHMHVMRWPAQSAWFMWEKQHAFGDGWWENPHVVSHSFFASC